MRALVVNADDFGQSAAVNRGVIRAHEAGIVTSASLMVRWPAAAEATEYGRRHPGLGLGLHVDLGEWRYADGAWVPVYEVLEARADVAREVERQLDAFRALAGREPTHLDSHQHVHREEPARSAVLGLGARLGIPVRHLTDGVAYCGAFYGQSAEGEPVPDAIGVDALLAILRTLPPGITELACHPADGVDLDTMYAREREVELAALCDPRVRSVVREEGIRLCTFREVRDRLGAARPASRPARG
jgi:predicted glycoside hydrolase/deacetylase ChbG (UPF0249 family)